MSDKENYNSSWIMGPELPMKMTASTMTEFQNSAIVTGGIGETDGLHLYRLSSPIGPWIEMKQNLKEGRYWLVSFLVPDELVNCY